MPCPAPCVQELRDCTPAEVAEVLLSQLERIDVDAAPMAATVTALTSGLFSQLAAGLYGSPVAPPTCW